ncbi:RHS repeat domain-containing protein [Dysgonomonas sp. ZJ279]|uniref:RHS repeat domain-containing protein n=1 Tax=Dysgonomonas sp. ZJ279 TaxID=2709796 RepID=UPI0021023775|nr:RHS repeat-associated core domain-containing protein [Dysgonomonas sp. ZJ279]
MDIKSPVGEARNEYTYSASGAKLKVVQKWNPNYSTNPIVGSAVTVSTLTSTKTTDYAGNKVYENGSLKRVLVDGGYVEGGVYYFFLTDHLGNNRVVAKADGMVVQKSHYYPFGMAFAESTDLEKQPYKYNGKELEQEHQLNMYDYHARQMEPGTGRFMSVDPLAELHYDYSPYAYVLNNPLKYIDPTGMDTSYVNPQGETIVAIPGGENVTMPVANDVVVESSNSGTSYWGIGSTFFGILGESDAYTHNKRFSNVFKSYYSSTNYHGSAHIDKYGKIWRNAENSGLLKKSLTNKMPFINRYGSKWGKAGGILNTVDVSYSLASAYSSVNVGNQLYHINDAALKSPAFIPGVGGVVYGLLYGDVIKPIWHTGINNHQENLDKGMPPTMIFYIGGLHPGGNFESLFK